MRWTPYHLHGGELSQVPERSPDEALVTIIVKYTQPFSVVEDVGFRDFLHKLDSAYVLPKAKRLF